MKYRVNDVVGACTKRYLADPISTDRCMILLSLIQSQTIFILATKHTNPVMLKLTCDIDIKFLDSTCR